MSVVTDQRSTLSNTIPKKWEKNISIFLQRPKRRSVQVANNGMEVGAAVVMEVGDERAHTKVEMKYQLHYHILKNTNISSERISQLVVYKIQIKVVICWIN